MADNDDESLVRQAQCDSLAFASLYDRYVDRIYAYVLRCTNDHAVAQDVTSATFEKALLHLRRYRWQGQSFCAWLYRIAHNETIAIHRKQKILAPLWLWRPDEVSAEQEIESRQKVNELQEVLDFLPDSDREILILRFYEDLSNAEIATIMGCSVHTLYVRTHRALNRLRKELERVRSASREAFNGE